MNQNASVHAGETARALRRLYFLRTIFSVLWAALLAVFSKTNNSVAVFLFVIYPLWDVFATYLDIKASPAYASKTPQYVNMGVGIATTIGVILALQTGVPEAIIVFGVWAIVTGLIQLVLALRRRKQISGLWPLIISGAQSMLGGGAFILMAHAPNKGIDTLAGYAAFGAFYFLLAGIRLTKTINAKTPAIN